MEMDDNSAHEFSLISKAAAVTNDDQLQVSKKEQLLLMITLKGCYSCVIKLSSLQLFSFKAVIWRSQVNYFNSSKQGLQTMRCLC